MTTNLTQEPGILLRRGQYAPGRMHMAYTTDGYTLHKRSVTLKGGRVQTIYFFAKNPPKSGEPCDMPPGYVVGKNPKTGLPYLKRA